MTSSNSYDNIKKLAEKEITRQEIEDSISILKTKKTAIFIVAYNAEKHLESVIKRIPEYILNLFAEIFIIDDSSTDSTFEIGLKIKSKYSSININIYRTPFNRGYGGNQKLGYLYCIKQNYDYVILLHGDGQYAPEYLPRVVAKFKNNADAVFASRMINKKMALKGGMPLYKWFGNQILTYLENKLLNLNLSEFHTGFRAYSISLLSKVPFIYNSDGFHFDTEIIIQAAKTNSIIEEASIPTFYGDEKCHVNGIKYALNCIRAVIQYHLVNIGLYYQKNFDFGVFENDNYYMKKSKYSLHQFILNNSGLNAQTISIELGANKGLISSCFAELSEKHYAVDNISPKNAGKSICYALNLNNNFSQKIENSGNFDVCFSLDIIEHLDSPENFLNEIFNLLKQKGTLFISTANISYFPMRISLLSGQFNYSKRGILDLTHKRLFTINGFKKLLNQQGFRVIKIKGFGPPITDLISKNKFFRLLEKIHYYFSNFFPSIFAYNYLIIAQRMDSISEIFDKTISSGKNKNL